MPHSEKEFEFDMWAARVTGTSKRNHQQILVQFSIFSIAQETSKQLIIHWLLRMPMGILSFEGGHYKQQPAQVTEEEAISTSSGAIK